MRENERNNILNEIHEYCINEKTREIFLHSSFSYDEDKGIDFKKANQFLKNILYLDSIAKKDITIHMHSIGGEYHSGMLIYDAIKNCRSVVTIVCHGEISSMGIIVLQAADRRISMPNCKFLLHFGTSGICNHEQNVAFSWIQSEKDSIEVMLDILSKKIKSTPLENEILKNKNENQIKKYIKKIITTKGDWILTSDLALSYGLIDMVY